MGQTIGRDLGLQQSEEEQERIERIQRIVSELAKKKLNTNQSMSMQPSRFMSQDEEDQSQIDDEDDEDDDDDDEDEEDMSIDDSYSHQQHKKGIISSDSSRLESQKQSRRQSQNMANGEAQKNPYSRPFQSIKIDKFFVNQDENEEEEHEQDMLNDMSDDDEDNDNQNNGIYNNPKPLSKQNSHEKTKKIHNIRDESEVNNQNSVQSGVRNTANEGHQIKFQSVFNKDFDFNLQSESEQSQFGIVFSSDEEQEDEEQKQSQQEDRIRSGVFDVASRGTVDKSKLEDEDDNKSKNQDTILKTQSSRGNSTKTRHLQSVRSGTNGKNSSHFFPSSRKTQQQSGNDKQDSTKKDYDKYLNEFFPDRKSQRPEI